MDSICVQQQQQQEKQQHKPTSTNNTSNLKKSASTRKTGLGKLNYKNNIDQQQKHALSPPTKSPLRSSQLVPGLPSPPPRGADDIFSLSDTLLAEKFQFIEECGFGNWGSVWKVSSQQPDHRINNRDHNNDGNSTLAIKLVHRNKSPTTSARVRSLWTEFKVLRNLKRDRHPNIIRFYDFMISPSYALVSMEYHSRLLHVKLTEPVGKKYIQQLVSAVHHLHSKGITHNDIKPTNLLLSSDDQLILCDFGFAQLYTSNSTTPFVSTSSWGTPEYLSPERAKGRPHDDRLSDIFSMGVTAYELVVGRTPFEKDESEEFLDKDALEVYYQRTLSGNFWGPTNISPAFKTLIRAMIEPDPAMRVNSCSKVANYAFFTGINRHSLNSIDNLQAELSKRFPQEEQVGFENSSKISKFKEQPSTWSKYTKPNVRVLVDSSNHDHPNSINRPQTPNTEKAISNMNLSPATKRKPENQNQSAALKVYHDNTDTFINEIQPPPINNDILPSKNIHIPTHSRDNSLSTQIELLNSPRRLFQNPTTATGPTTSSVDKENFNDSTIINPTSPSKKSQLHINSFANNNYNSSNTNQNTKNNNNNSYNLTDPSPFKNSEKRIPRKPVPKTFEDKILENNHNHTKNQTSKTSPKKEIDIFAPQNICPLPSSTPPSPRKHYIKKTNQPGGTNSTTPALASPITLTERKKVDNSKKEQASPSFQKVISGDYFSFSPKSPVQSPRTNRYSQSDTIQRAQSPIGDNNKQRKHMTSSPPSKDKQSLLSNVKDFVGSIKRNNNNLNVNLTPTKVKNSKTTNESYANSNRQHNGNNQKPISEQIVSTEKIAEFSARITEEYVRESMSLSRSASLRQASPVPTIRLSRKETNQPTPIKGEETAKLRPSMTPSFINLNQEYSNSRDFDLDFKSSTSTSLNQCSTTNTNDINLNSSSATLSPFEGKNSDSRPLSIISNSAPYEDSNSDGNSSNKISITRVSKLNRKASSVSFYLETVSSQESLSSNQERKNKSNLNNSSTSNVSTKSNTSDHTTRSNNSSNNSSDNNSTSTPLFPNTPQEEEEGEKVNTSTFHENNKPMSIPNRSISRRQSQYLEHLQASTTVVNSPIPSRESLDYSRPRSFERPPVGINSYRSFDLCHEEIQEIRAKALNDLNGLPREPKRKKQAHDFGLSRIGSIGKKLSFTLSKKQSDRNSTSLSQKQKQQRPTSEYYSRHSFIPNISTNLQRPSFQFVRHSEDLGNPNHYSFNEDMFNSPSGHEKSHSKLGAVKTFLRKAWK